MADIHELPWELMFLVLDNLDDVKDWVSLGCVRSDFYGPVIKKIWGATNTTKHYKIFLWACATGATRAVNRVLDMGLSANSYFLCHSRVTGEHHQPAFYLDPPHSCDVLPDQIVFRGEPDTGDDVNSFWQPLHIAAYHGHRDVVDTLLKKGVWVDAPSKFYSAVDRPWTGKEFGKNSPLHLAISEGHDDIAKTLICNGASIYVDHRIIQTPETELHPERGRITAFHLCAFKGLVSTAKLLINMGHGDAIDELDEYGCSPAMYAYHFDQTDFLVFLLGQGASLRIAKNESRPFVLWSSTLLHQACLDNRWQLVAKLTEHGTDPLLPDEDGLQPLQYCISGFAPISRYHITEIDEQGHVETQKMISIVESCKMHVGVNRKTLNTASKYAIGGGLYPFLSFLLDNGLDITTLLEDCLPHDGYEKIDPMHSPRLHKVRGLGCYVRALKNLCCHVSRHGKTYEFDDGLPILRHSARIICSYIPSAPKNESDKHQKPQMPVDLLFVCLAFGRDTILEEMVKVFDMNYSAYSEEEIWRLLKAMRQQDTSSDSRLAHCVNVLLQEDRDGRILQHSRSFETLCDIFLRRNDDGESVILDYLDRGGRYNFTFEDGSTALFAATNSGCVKLAERLLDLGHDPNKFTTRQLPRHCGWAFFWDAREPAFIRLLIERGFNPLRMAEENPGLDCLFKKFMRGDDEDYAIFQDMCRLTLNEDTDDGDLFYLLDFACSRGYYHCIQEMRLHAKSRVDAVIREKAALFLPKLLINLSPVGDQIAGYFTTIMDMDEAIDTIGLLFQLGPRSPPETHHAPGEPHTRMASPWDKCDFWQRLQYKVFWCLNERISIDSSSGRRVVTILGQRIQWPKGFEGPADSEEYAEEMYGVFRRIRIPWGCIKCEYGD
ncbi:hypothetical protein PG997_006882 [Apiospora hydei]|uniref:Ankyrin n=1 Tax=Apiospora hydei TaxID=1337664 RepID=A0ABR1WRW6_9PEZI